MQPRRLASVACTGLLAAALTVVCAADAEQAARSQQGAAPRAGGKLPAGWQLLVHDGCQFAVPRSWRPDADNASVVAADGSNLSVRRFRITSWSRHTAQILASVGPVKVLEDSARRLWFEFGDQQRTQHFIDVATGPGVCAALLEIRATLPDATSTARTIADSIGAAAD
jgi:hypothetical protein